MTTSIELLAKFLDCDPDDCKKLDSIVLDVDEFFDAAKSKTLEGMGKAVYEKALEYLMDMYRFASQKIQDNPDLYSGSILHWNSDLLMNSIKYLDPESDLHYAFDSTEFYMELDNWDLYQSVINEINVDYSSGYTMNELVTSFTKAFYGGEKTPSKYDDLLL